MELKRYFIQLAYNGKNYHGWQIQPNAISVQEELNKALTVLLKNDINVVGAGRTDTGVHASFFVAHFETDATFDPKQLTYKLNRFIRGQVSVEQIFEVDSEMHARFSALSRSYKYFISKKNNPFSSELAYHHRVPLDVEKMNEAGKILFDYIDFTSFSRLHTDVKTNNCRIDKVQWTEDGDFLVFEIKADRFLRNMVRAIVGTLIQVGEGKCTIEDFRKIIEDKNRGRAGASAPGNALFLTDIEYPEEVNNQLNRSAGSFFKYL
ncbi:tRNA pseudouridine(38-40) synthase TruA [Prolixibacteraceae bacterium JC049]|nr:tRNA pseudouridine(38-40) synthase TruA [Prolixibacteraceae bacterium JC049]